MRAISLWQPWATLCCLPHPDDLGKEIVRSVKGYETRSWPAKCTGPLLIHAAKRCGRDQNEAFFWPIIFETMKANGYEEPEDLAYGAIIGTVNLVHCHPSEPIRTITDKYALAMGDYRDGRFAWEINAPALFDQPIPFRGQQGFFNVSTDLIK